MTKILVINNYYRRELYARVKHITDLLEKFSEPYEVIHFTEVGKIMDLIEDEFEAVILSGSSLNPGNPEDLIKYEREISLIQRVNIPILGICFGHQLIGKVFGSEIRRLPCFVKGFEEVEILEPDDIFSTWKKGERIFLNESHQDYVSDLPRNFTWLATSKECKIEAMRHNYKPIYGVQAHIERVSKEHKEGHLVFRNFLKNVVKKR